MLMTNAERRRRLLYENKMKDEDVIRVQVPGALEYIAIVRRAVDAVGEQIHLAPGARAAVELAVGEACNNAFDGPFVHVGPMHGIDFFAQFYIGIRRSNIFSPCA